MLLDPRRVTRLLALAVAIGFVAGCVTGGTSSSAPVPGLEGTVVERSKPEAPAWIGLAVGRIHETETTLQFVELRTRLRDLPLGLKQTQLGALEASRAALIAVVKDRLDDDRSSLPSFSAQQLDRVVDDVTGELHGRQAKVTDIYFEKLESDSGEISEYFNAFVLVTIPRDQMTVLMSNLGSRLISSGDPSLRQLGDTLRMNSRANGEAPQALPAAATDDDLSH